MPDRAMALNQIDAQPYAWPFDGHWSAGDTALLLLGFQRGIVDLLDADEAMAKAQALLRLANAAGMGVIMSRRGRSENESGMAQRRRAMGDVVFDRQSGPWQLRGMLDMPADAVFIDHAGDNAFYGTSLEADLRQRGIRNLLIAGLPTEGLVHATQRAANDMGFECLAVSDACKGTDGTRHTAQLRITTFGNGLFGAVATTDAVRAALSA